MADRPFPRAGDEVIAIDREVAIAIAIRLDMGENPNAFLRELFDLPPSPTARETDKYRTAMLAKYPEIVREMTS